MGVKSYYANRPGFFATRLDAMTNGLTNWGLKTMKPSSGLVAIGNPLIGNVVGQVIVYGENSGVLFSVYKVNVATGAATLLGTGTVNTSHDLVPDYTANVSEYLAIKVFTTQTSGQNIYGGYCATQMGGSLDRLTPDRFQVNDD